MAAAGPPEWRRRYPSRALRRLGWLVVGGGAAAAVAWLLFGAEPDRLASGEANPLALAPAAVTVVVAAAALPPLLALLRRPLVVADHYALRVRPGAGRTLLLPWAEVSEVVGVTVRGEPLLLVRRYAVGGRLGDRPRWYDQRPLRAAGRAGARYHLAVRMDEFVGDPAELLAALAAWAPEQVRFVDRL